MLFISKVFRIIAAYWRLLLFFVREVVLGDCSDLYGRGRDAEATFSKALESQGCRFTTRNGGVTVYCSGGKVYYYREKSSAEDFLKKHVPTALTSPSRYDNNGFFSRLKTIFCLCRKAPVTHNENPHVVFLPFLLANWVQSFWPLKYQRLEHPTADGLDSVELDDQAVPLFCRGEVAVSLGRTGWS